MNVRVGRYLCRLDAASLLGPAASSHMVHETFIFVRSKTEKHSRSDVGTEQFETDSRGLGRPRQASFGRLEPRATAKSRRTAAAAPGGAPSPRRRYGSVIHDNSANSARCASATSAGRARWRRRARPPVWKPRSWAWM